MSERKFFKRFKKFIRKNYGRRCSEFEPSCVVCKLWKVYDDCKDECEADGVL